MAKNVVQSFKIGGYEYQQRLVYCGNKRCSKCPHGPYWYMIISLRNGKQVTKYIGKFLPKEITPPC